MLRSTIGRELLTRQDSEQDDCVSILTHLASEPASHADRVTLTARHLGKRAAKEILTPSLCEPASSLLQVASNMHTLIIYQVYR